MIATGLPTTVWADLCGRSHPAPAHGFAKVPLCRLYDAAQNIVCGPFLLITQYGVGARLHQQPAHPNSAVERSHVERSPSAAPRPHCSRLGIQKGAAQSRRKSLKNVKKQSGASLARQRMQHSVPPAVPLHKLFNRKCMQCRH